MLTGLSTAGNALNAFQTSLDTTSNNLANINTTGFKRSRVDFQDFVYSGSNDNQVGNGVQIGAISPKGFGQGPLVKTGNENDVAIQGNGLLMVQMPDGSTKYTRDGSLHRDPSGMLVNINGLPVQPAMIIPDDTNTMTIGSDGTVTVMTKSAPNTPTVVGQLQMANFINPEGLYIDANNLYTESDASGSPSVGAPGTEGRGRLVQFNLEQSNVDLTTELTTMVTTQQAYVANSKVVTTTNQMVTSALSLIS